MKHRCQQCGHIGDGPGTCPICNIPMQEIQPDEVAKPQAAPAPEPAAVPAPAPAVPEPEVPAAEPAAPEAPPAAPEAPAAPEEGGGDAAPPAEAA